MADSVFLSPRSIAVVGASDREGSVGRAITSNIVQHFTGSVFPVNPGRREVFGLPAVDRVSDIVEPVDLAVVVTKNDLVCNVLEDCGRKGIRGAIVVTSGFGEVNEEGRRLEKEMTAVARRHNIQVVGPNCLGVMNLDPGIMLNATFLKFTPRSGDIALVSQSGAVCAALVENAAAQGIGFSAIFSMGNKAVMGETEILDILADHEASRVIVMYLEDIADGAAFMQACRRITRERRKPVLVLKAGRSAEGARAAMSHTGAMMGSDEVAQALLAQSGAIRVDTLSELFDYASAFSMQPLPQKAAAVILSNAGGAAIVSTDACARLKIPLADITEVRPEIDALIPPWGSSRNPVDIVGDADYRRFAKVMDRVMAQENVGAVVAMCTPSATLDYDRLAGAIVEMAHKHDKTVLASLMGDEEGPENRRILREGGVPHYRYAEDAISALGAMMQFRTWLNTPLPAARDFKMELDTVEKLVDNALAAGRRHLLEPEGLELLRACGFPYPAHTLARNEQEAVAAAREIGFPVVMKIVSADIVHKTDAGGVILNLNDEPAVRGAFADLVSSARNHAPGAVVEGVLVMEMVASGHEMIVGARREPRMGPVVMLGAGGIHVEVFKDVAYRLAPVSPEEVRGMLAQVRTARLLDGFRGAPAADTGALVECVERCARLMLNCPRIQELDMNPLRVLERGRGCRVLDIRVGLRDAAE